MDSIVFQKFLYDLNNITSIENSANSFEFLFAFLLAIVLSYVISLFYDYALKDQNFSDNQLVNSIVIISVTTFVVVFIVKSSITLSLGLVGALSIVRFRTPIKDPIELAAIFVAIAVGICLAVFQYSIAIVFTLFCCIYFFLLKKYRDPNINGIFSKILFLKSMTLHKKYNFEFQSIKKIDQDLLENIFKKYDIQEKFINLSSHNKTSNYNYLLMVKSEKQITSAISEIKLQFKDLDFHLSRL